MSTAILPFATWDEGSNQARIPANDNSLRNQILNGRVISDATTAQPGSPTEGDIYILAATHTGAQWATFDEDDLVIYSGGTWYAFAPVNGVVVNLNGTLRQFISSAWDDVSGGVAGASETQTGEMISGYIGTVTDKTYRLVVKAAHGGHITETTTRSESGTCTATFKINTVALGGTANSVCSSEQSQAHNTTDDFFAANDDIEVTVSSNSACIGMSFTIKYTRTLES
jgi:hypothetical protein